MRKKIKGSAKRPRMSVFCSNKHMYVQFVDDEAEVTVASASTAAKNAGDAAGKLNVETAKKLGALAADAAKAKGIDEVVFDRGGFRYHGRVKALADAAREAGLKF